MAFLCSVTSKHLPRRISVSVKLLLLSICEEFFFYNTLMMMSSPTIQKTFKSCSSWFKAGLEIWCLTLWVIALNYTLQAILEWVKISDWGEMIERELFSFSTTLKGLGYCSVIGKEIFTSLNPDNICINYVGTHMNSGMRIKTKLQ